MSKNPASNESVQEGLLNNSIRGCELDSEVAAEVPETVQTMGQLALYLMENNLI